MTPLYMNPPLAINLLVTSKCNASCPCCNQKKTNGELSIEEIERIARELKPRYMPIGGGEPLLRDDLNEIIETINKYSKTAVTTNGLLIKERLEELKNVLQVQVSLNGFKDTHETIKDTEFKEVVRNINLLRQNNIPFGINVILTEEVSKELRKFVKYCFSLGAKDVRILAPKPPLRMPETLQIPRSQKIYIDGCLASTLGIGFGCMAWRFGCTVFPNGQASPCSHIYRPLGKLTKELWERDIDNIRHRTFVECNFIKRR